MSHIVESCPLTKLNGGLSRLHAADEDAVSWLTNYGKWHAYQKKKSATPDLQLPSQPKLVLIVPTHGGLARHTIGLSMYGGLKAGFQ